MRSRLRPQHFSVLEAALVGLFLIQSLRFVIGMTYSNIAGAEVLSLLPPDAAEASEVANRLSPGVVTGELTILFYILLLPLIALIGGRLRFLLPAAAILVAIGRLSAVVQTDPRSTVAASLTVGAGLLYIALVIQQRARLLPYVFLLGFGLDQLLRAIGDTWDPSLVPAEPLIRSAGLTVAYREAQIVLSALLVIAALVAYFGLRRAAAPQEPGLDPNRGLLTFWGGVGLGALLFLEMALFALPNAVAGRAGVDYTTFVPLLMAATLLPLIPWVRIRARSFIALFDGGVRGWVWMLLTALLVVVGTRIAGLIGGIALVVAQFMLSATWWWLARPRAEKERNFTGLWMLVAVIVFAVLVVADFFTYEYAYVRDLAGNLQFLNTVIPPLLRGFRGMGLGVLLLGVFLACLPMTLMRRRIPWGEQRAIPAQSALAVAAVVLLSLGSALAARPPLVQAVSGVDSLRVGTYNIHGGYDEFFNFTLDDMATTIQQSGANVVLLQEVEVGRLTSFGVDQALWLARRTGKDRRFFPTNEGMQGLAVLSNAPMVFHQGTLLTSVGQQTGAQHVQITTDAGASAIAVYNTWLGPLLDLSSVGSPEEQQQDQQRQLAELFTLIARDYPELAQVRLVVGGTFNNVPDSPLIEQMRVSGFNDPFAGLPPERSSTFLRSNAQARFDYLFVRSVTPLGALVMENDASDHRMAVIEILLSRRASN